MFSFPWWNHKLLLLLLLFPLLLNLHYNPVVAQRKCSYLCNRRDWKKLNSTEKTTYVNAVVDFYQKDTVGYHELVKIHDTFGFSGIHNTLHFLPWHRYYLMEYQKNLRRFLPGLCIPYWDVSIQSQTFAQSPVFHLTEGFGALTRNCVIFGKLDSKGLLDAQGNCLTRDPMMTQNPDMPLTIDGDSIVKKILEETTFEPFTRKLEVGYHSQVHGAVAGHMVTYFAPLDPLFFLHHCKVDQLWAEWQSRNFPVRLTEISTNSSRPAIERLDSPLLGYPDISVAAMMDITNLCYYYEGVSLNPTASVPSTTTTSPPPPPPPPPPLDGNRETVPQPKGYMRLSGLPEGKAINLATTDPEIVRSLKAQNTNAIKNNLPMLQKWLIDIPIPRLPTWCWDLPGLPEDKCFDKRKMNEADIQWWGSSSRLYVEQYWNLDADKVVPIPKSLIRRSTGKIIDLGEICFLKPSTPIPDVWIKMIGFDAAYVRQTERENAALVAKINSLPGLIPSSAVVNDVEGIAKILTQAGAGISKVICKARGIPYEFDFQKDYASTAKFISDSIKGSIVTPKESIRGLATIIAS